MQPGTYSHGYFPHHGQMPPPGGQFRAQYPQHMNNPTGGNLSFQSMTSHWNLSSNSMPPPPPPPSHHHHPPISQTGKSKHSSSSGQPALKPPKPPDKPLLPYMRYSRKMWEQIKKTDGQEMKVWEVGKIIGQKWRELSDDDKQPYFDEYEAEKLVYDDQMKVYRNSPAYRQYLEAKKNAGQQSASQNSIGPGLNELAPPPPAVIAPPRHSGDPRLALLQQDDDDEDEYLTMKQVAAARFHRNHRLMGEIFNKSSVPDTRTLVTPARLENLKKQARSLEQHQKKLEEEVHQMENRYNAKKGKFLEDAENFRREHKRIQDTPPTSWKKPPVQLSAKDIPGPSETARYTKL